MVIELFSHKTGKQFACLTVRPEYVGKDPQAFLGKQAKAYAKIRDEVVRAVVVSPHAEAVTLKEAIASP